MYPVNSLVKITEEYRSILEDSIRAKYVRDPSYYKEVLDCSSFVFLGEINQMSGHGIYAGKNGKIYYGFHLQDFEMIPEEEC